MLHEENFGFTVRCINVEQAGNLARLAIMFGVLTTRVISFGQYIQIILDPHEKHDEAVDCWRQFLEGKLE